MKGQSEALEGAEELVCPNAALLRLMGLWAAPGPAGGGAARGWLFWAMAAFIAATSAGKLLLDTPEELAAIADYGYTVFHLSAVTVKVACFILQRSTVRELVNLLADTRKTHGRREANHRVRHFYQRRASTVYRVLQALVVAVLCLWISSPALQRKAVEEGERQPPNPIWMPERSPGYEIVYTLQALCGTVAVQSSMLLDASFYKLTLMVTAELQVLNDNLAVLGRAALSADPKDTSATGAAGRERDVAIPPIKKPAAPVSEDNDQLLYSQLVENVRHHQAIIKCFDLLQSVITYSISIVLLSNILTVCFSIFVVSVSDGGLKRALKTIVGIPSVLGETGMFCVFGQMVIDQSERLRVSAHSCNWPDADARFKRALLILVLRTSQPLEFTVGKLIHLSNETFLQILNSSYTLINLLYQFQGSND